MPPCPLDDAGRFVKPVTDYEGMHIKVSQYTSGCAVPAHATFMQAADKEIMKHLKAKGRLVVQSTINHSYPYCWRCVLPQLLVGRLEES